jgi:hypothetical protein
MQVKSIIDFCYSARLQALMFTSFDNLTMVVKFQLHSDLIRYLCVVFELLGLFYVIGVAVWGGEYYNSLGSVGATFDITAAFLALLGAVFLILSVISPSSGGKNSTSPA